jgi:uncharacterized protein (TIGR02594 family)
MEPRWLFTARAYLGTREIAGPRHNPVILGWLHRLKATWLQGDEAPWCGTFCGAVLDEAGLGIPRHFYRARAWLDWGSPLALPVPGCVVILERGPSMGHVGFVVGRDAGDRLLVLGGNQGNAVTVAAFPRARVLGYRWPAGEPLLHSALPVGEAGVSRSEA